MSALGRIAANRQKRCATLLSQGFWREGIESRAIEAREGRIVGAVLDDCHSSNGR